VVGHLVMKRNSVQYVPENGLMICILIVDDVAYEDWIEARAKLYHDVTRWLYIFLNTFFMAALANLVMSFALCCNMLRFEIRQCSSSRPLCSSSSVAIFLKCCSSNSALSTSDMP
jgi:hypothetical protein